MSDSEQTRAILTAAKTIAVVGLSPKSHRASYTTAAYMQQQGYTIIPVNPLAETILGETCYRDVMDIPDEITIDIVNCFRKSEDIPPIAEAAIAKKAGVLWMQLDIENAQAKALAEAAGLQVVENRCLKIEHAKFA